MQWSVDAVEYGCSVDAVEYGCSAVWMQWSMDAVECGCSGVWMQWSVDAMVSLLPSCCWSSYIVTRRDGKSVVTAMGECFDILPAFPCLLQKFLACCPPIRSQNQLILNSVFAEAVHPTTVNTRNVLLPRHYNTSAGIHQSQCPEVNDTGTERRFPTCLLPFL